MTWNRNYEAIHASPMRITDTVIGELLWLSVRLSMVAVAFTSVIAAFGIPRSPLALLAVPAAMLTGLAFGAPIMAFAATRRRGGSFNGLFRFVITPLFLFSGVFFPISRLPEALQVVAWFTPLFHGVQLVRGLVLAAGPSPLWAVHAGYLLAMLAIGVLLAVRTFRRKLS
jgi:lipooligosaccharide transport system permease protein